MDAFEGLVSALLRKEGYWAETGFKVELSKVEKRRIGRPSSPRWEIDVIAYKGRGNHVLVVECKSFLDSTGVRYQDVSGKNAEGAKRYKLFNDAVLRKSVFSRLCTQLAESGACPRKPEVTLCLATGKVASPADRENLRKLFKSKSWILWDDEWIREKLANVADSGYEDSVATVAAKILMRRKSIR